MAGVMYTRTLIPENNYQDVATVPLLFFCCYFLHQNVTIHRIELLLSLPSTISCYIVICLSLVLEIVKPWDNTNIRYVFMLECLQSC